MYGFGSFLVRQPDARATSGTALLGWSLASAKNIRFPDFEGAVDDFGDEDQMAVYRVAKEPDLDKAGRSVARRRPRRELYTGPRRDGARARRRSRATIVAASFQFFTWMTVVPHGPDMIETWNAYSLGLSSFGPMAQGGVDGGPDTRPGTNAPMGKFVDGSARRAERPDVAETDFCKRSCEGPRDISCGWIVFTGSAVLCPFALGDGDQRGPVRGVGSLLCSVFADSHFQNAHAVIRKRPPD